MVLGTHEILKLIADAPLKVVPVHFESDGEEFDLELQAFSRAELQKLRRKGIKPIFDREARAWRDEADDDRIQEFLADTAIKSWTGLTGTKLAHFCRHTVNLDGNREDLEKELPCTLEVRRFILKHAMYARKSGIPIGFADWLLEQLTGAAEEIGVVEEEKKDT